jgi:hypothetical protein
MGNGTAVDVYTSIMPTCTCTPDTIALLHTQTSITHNRVSADMKAPLFLACGRDKGHSNMWMAVCIMANGSKTNGMGKAY